MFLISGKECYVRHIIKIFCDQIILICRMAMHFVFQSHINCFKFCSHGCEKTCLHSNQNAQIRRLPCQDTVSGQNRPTSETPFERLLLADRKWSAVTCTRMCLLCTCNHIIEFLYTCNKLAIVVSRERQTKVLIRMRRCICFCCWNATQS